MSTTEKEKKGKRVTVHKAIVQIKWNTKMYSIQKKVRVKKAKRWDMGNK